MNYAILEWSFLEYRLSDNVFGNKIKMDNIL